MHKDIAKETCTDVAVLSKQGAASSLPEGGLKNAASSPHLLEVPLSASHSHYGHVTKYAKKQKVITATCSNRLMHVPTDIA